MADIATTYSYLAGTPFEVAEHNRQIKAIQTALNSQVTVDNTEATFSVNESMVMREQAALGRQEWSLDSTAYMADAVGSALEGDEEDEAVWRTVGGSGIRWYQPYPVMAAMLQWSFFCSTNTWQIRESSANSSATDDVEIDYDTMFTAFVRQRGQAPVEITSQRRAPPRSCVYPASKVDGTYSELIEPKPDKRWVQVEAHNALQWDHHYMINPGELGGTGSFALAAGWHELYVAVRMSRPQRSIGVFENVETPFGTGVRTHDMIMNNKAAFGIRNARVVTFL